MNHYMVVSPELTQGHYDDMEPPEEYFCIAKVQAETKSQAKALAIKQPCFRDWVIRQRGDGASPFTGLRVYSEKCEHGVCHCQECKGECPECDAACEEAIRLENESE